MLKKKMSLTDEGCCYGSCCWTKFHHGSKWNGPPWYCEIFSIGMCLFVCLCLCVLPCGLVGSPKNESSSFHLSLFRQQTKKDQPAACLVWVVFFVVIIWSVLYVERVKLFNMLHHSASYNASYEYHFISDPQRPNRVLVKAGVSTIPTNGRFIGAAFSLCWLSHTVQTQSRQHTHPEARRTPPKPTQHSKSQLLYSHSQLNSTHSFIHSQQDSNNTTIQ